MANVSVYNMEGKEVGTIELNDAVFGVEVNEHLVHMAVVQQLANNRQGTQKAKTRSEVQPDLPSGQAAAWYSLPFPEITLSNLTRKRREQL